ncbi:hypothetical protein ABTL40_19365, partial [Acinetobacter baumannii]
TPWDAVVEGIDALGAPPARPDSAAIRPLPSRGDPAMLTAGVPIPANPPLSTSQPTTPQR